MIGSRRLAMLADRPRRPRLVLAHEARVADDVGGEDRGKLPGFRHGVVSELTEAYHEMTHRGA